MKSAIKITLQALYEGKEITANNTPYTTRISNIISVLRNQYDIGIITDRVNLKSGKWYGSYRLDGSDKNLDKVRLLTKQDEIKESRV
ncbi:MAG TPA: hypothetical protein EYG70_01370 [Sulfurimonas sp.]|nr:hypothetical protein [Sulfurimonas sp.]